MRVSARPIAFSIMCLLSACLASGALAAGQSYALIVSGDPGTEPNSAVRFHDWNVRWVAVLTDVYGFQKSNIKTLRSPSKPLLTPRYGEEQKPGTVKIPPELAAVPPAEIASLENVLAAIAKIVKDSTARDQVVVVLIGHGYVQQEIGKMSLPGADFSSAEFVRAFSGLKAKQFILLNFVPSSMPWAAAVSKGIPVAKKASVVEALSSQTYFSEFMLRSLAKQKTNLLDAFNDGCLELFLWFHNQFIVKDSSKNSKVVVHGTDFQKIWAKMYPDDVMEPGDPAPRKPTNEAFQNEQWEGRRIIVDLPALEDNGDDKPTGLVSSISHGEDGLDTRTTGTQKITPLPTSRGGDGEASRSLVLGEP